MLYIILKVRENDTRFLKCFSNKDLCSPLWVNIFSENILLQLKLEVSWVMSQDWNVCPSLFAKKVNISLIDFQGFQVLPQIFKLI